MSKSDVHIVEGGDTTERSLLCSCEMADDVDVWHGDSGAVTVLRCDDDDDDDDDADETRDGRTEYNDCDAVSLVDAADVERMLDSQPATLELGLLPIPASWTGGWEESDLLVKGRDRRNFAGDLTGDTASCTG